MINPLQPIVGPFTIAPGFMTLCCHSYSSRPAAFEEYQSLKGQKGYLKLYPNPTNGRNLNIAYQFGHNAKVIAELYDITGRLIDVVEMPFNDNTLECYFILDVQKLNLSAGTYVLKLKTNQEEYVQKFVITK
jgi:hypothetical protein